MSDEEFVFDAWAKNHLLEWFQAGMAPNDWYLGTLEEFIAWIEENKHEFSQYASWTELARVFEKETDK